MRENRTTGIRVTGFKFYLTDEVFKKVYITLFHLLSDSWVLIPFSVDVGY